MKTVIPTRAQLGYANGNPHPFDLVAGESVELPDDLADTLIAGGDAALAEPRAGDPSSDAPPAPPADPEPVAELARKRQRKAKPEAGDGALLGDGPAPAEA